MATTLSMKDPNPGIWFKFDESDPKSGEIALRPLNSERRKEIRKKAIKKRVEYKHGQRFPVEEPDDDLFSELVWDYSIVDWSGLVDDAGNEIPCTLENKVFLMRKHIGFARFVSAKLEELSDGYENQLSIENANLSSGSHGSETRTNQTATSAEK